jgi:hypothetical protein
MSVPGAEHPDKIANIVKGKGALEGMRSLYGGFLGHERFGIRQAGGKKAGGEAGNSEGEGPIWTGTGQGILMVSPHLHTPRRLALIGPAE